MVATLHIGSGGSLHTVMELPLFSLGSKRAGSSPFSKMGFGKSKGEFLLFPPEALLNLTLAHLPYSYLSGEKT